MTARPALPRLLSIMGSGETAPTMVKVHRQLLGRMGKPPVPAVLLGTPFGFQENAREIAGRAVTYFHDSLQAPISVAGLDPAANDDALLVTMVRDSSYVFAGPGSPSYALRKWQGTVIPALLIEKLQHGGCVVFASAAALTLGVATVPVYEIYKCGEDPRWLDGLDIMSATGLRVAIIPHYDNNEGGTHDTRFCYLGERRLTKMERDLPEGVFVLGVDEHTSCTFDLDAGTASVDGRGVMTVRAAGRSQTFPSGTVLSVTRILETADELARGTSGAQVTGNGEDSPHGNGEAPVAYAVRSVSTSPLVDLVREREADFAAALASRDMELATSTVLALERDVTEWSTDIPPGDELDRAHASLRSLILQLGRLSESGARDPREVIGPFVETLIALRDAARLERRFAEADLVRDRLVESGIEVRDTPDGSEWLLADQGEAETEAGA
ncbi:MAG: hypothetical protein ABR925_07630 [Acidimicrobiales bacterium]|jgi:hypothetical protein